MNLKAYKKRLGGSSTSNAIKNDTTSLVKRQFKDSPSYNRAILLDYNLDEIPIDIRIVNVDKSVYNKKFYLMPNQEAKEGYYIKIEDYDENHYWLIEEYERNGISHCAKVVYCNQMINFPDGKFLPCVATGESYGVKLSATNDILLETDTKVKLTVGRNIISELIEPDFRVIFEHSKQAIYKTGDTTHYKKGLIIMTCKKDKYNESLDDLENNLAWQPFHDYEDTNPKYEILGSDTMYVGKSYTYTLSPNTWCSFSVDNEEAIIESVSMSDITIKCDKANELIVLKAMIGKKVIEEKKILVVD